MRHTIATKFLAFLLAGCALAAALVCGGFALLLDQYGLYDSTPEEQKAQWFEALGEPVAENAASKRASQILGGCPAGLADRLYGLLSGLKEEHYYVTIQQDGQSIVIEGEPIENGITYEYSVKPRYAQMVRFYPAYIPEPTDVVASEGMVENPLATQPEDPNEKPDYDEKVDVPEDGQHLIYEVKYLKDSPAYTVSVTMSPKALEYTFHSNMISVYPYRNMLIWVAALMLMLALAAMVYLICAAGYTPEGIIKPGGFNCLPLDVYLLGGSGAIYFLYSQIWLMYTKNNNLNFFRVSTMVLLAIAIGTLVLGMVSALAAQIKASKGYWWRHSVLGICVLAIIKGIRALMSKMGVIWKWLLIAFVLLAMIVLSVFGAIWLRNNPWLFALFGLCCIGGMAIIAYGSWCFATILSGAQKMATGELDHKISTKYLHGSFRDCAEQMNALSEAAMQAVQSQVRAERMKTELITNVSHDIKTPLTSIINFVDLLRRPHKEEDSKEYLDVLSRQSQQLKKLIEDLMELSKASSGNIQANIITLDAAESVNQALGEFADKLKKVNLTPVFYQPEEPIKIAADGRLTWRVLSNLLSNAVKYATPGTRVYVELAKEEDKVLLSIKNVSKEELHLSADELLERFVRGDASRNREGSGLGLNIAKSLMEVQGGSLQLTLDGDLFKVTLTFPAV